LTRFRTKLSCEILELILPLQVDRSVLEEVIDWYNILFDPIYQLRFPDAEILNHAERPAAWNCVERNR